MDWLNILQQVFEVLVVPILAGVAYAVVLFIKTKVNESTNKIEDDKHDKYIAMLGDTITSCVIATNQTYVEALKDKNVFDKEAQKIAFSKTYEAVMSILTADAKDYLAEAYGDLEQYITEKIEAEVALNK